MQLADYYILYNWFKNSQFSEELYLCPYSLSCSCMPFPYTVWTYVLVCFIFIITIYNHYALFIFPINTIHMPCAVSMFMPVVTVTCCCSSIITKLLPYFKYMFESDPSLSENMLNIELSRNRKEKLRAEGGYKKELAGRKWLSSSECQVVQNTTQLKVRHCSTKLCANSAWVWQLWTQLCYVPAMFSCNFHAFLRWVRAACSHLCRVHTLHEAVPETSTDQLSSRKVYPSFITS